MTPLLVAFAAVCLAATSFLVRKVFSESLLNSTCFQRAKLFEGGIYTGCICGSFATDMIHPSGKVKRASWEAPRKSEILKTDECSGRQH